MTANYLINDDETDLFGLRLLRVDGVPDSHGEIEAEIRRLTPDLIRWKFPATYTRFNSLIDTLSLHGEFSGAVRHLVFRDTRLPGIRPQQPLTFHRYTGSTEDRATLEVLLRECYLDDPLGMRTAPGAAARVTLAQELASLIRFYSTHYVPDTFPDNHLNFAVLEGEAVGFCALSIRENIMYCPLGGVRPAFARRGVFSDILLFSRTLALDLDVEKLHMGIRAHNEASMHTFLKHSYGDTGVVLQDYIDYVYFLHSV